MTTVAHLDSLLKQRNGAWLERDEARAEVSELKVQLREVKNMAYMLAEGMDDRRLGYGAWCPACEGWLVGLQQLHTECGTCGGDVTWKPLSHLQYELRNAWRSAEDHRREAEASKQIAADAIPRTLRGVVRALNTYVEQVCGEG